MPFPYEFVDLFIREIPSCILAQMPRTLVESHSVLPIEMEGDVLVVAVPDPDEYGLKERIQFVCNREIRMVVASREGMDYAVRKSIQHMESPIWDPPI